MQRMRIVRPPTPYPNEMSCEDPLVYNNDGVTRMNSEGQATIKIMDGDGRFDESDAKWGLTYNNDEYGNGGVNGVVESTKNGEKHVYKIEIPNDELYKIFSSPPQQGSLDNRLRKDFSMTHSRGPRHRHHKNKNNVVFIEPIETIFEPGYQGDTDERSRSSEEEMMELLKTIRLAPQENNQRTRRMRVQYSSEPMRMFHRPSSSKRSSSSQRVARRTRRHMGRRHTNKFKRRSTPLYKMKKRTSSLKRSSKSNLPLTEINN
jgi:hypothetical protein